MLRLAGSAMATGAIEGGVGAAVAGGEMDAIVAAGAEAAGVALAEFGVIGVSLATVTFGVTTLLVGGAFEAGMGIGFAAAETVESVATAVFAK